MHTLTTPISRPAFPAPCLHVRAPGLLVPGHKTNLFNVGGRPGETRFRLSLQTFDGRMLFRRFEDDPEDAEKLWRRAFGTLPGLPDARLPSWFPALHDYPGAFYAVDTVTFLTTTGSNTYTRPGDWSNTNNIQLIGAGSNGGGAGSGTANTISGGAGGAFARKNNLSISSSETYVIGAANSANDSTFVNASTAKAQAARVAPGTNTGAVAGAAGSSVGDTTYSGGRGGNGSGAATGAPGGGGAAGPNGAGTQGVDSPNDASGTAGGAGGPSGGGAGGTAGTNYNNNAGAGGNGTEWDATHGSGGGGGGSGRENPAYIGGTGGRYGGGGGSGFKSGGANGVGYQGIIVVTYTPTIDTSAIFGRFGFM